MQGSVLRQRGAIAGGGADSGGGERFEVDESGLSWRGAVSDGGERSLLEGSDRWGRGAVSGVGERSLVVELGFKNTPIFFNFE